MAVVEIFATSDPAPGSVIAMQILFLPVIMSGTNRSCSSAFPNFSIGGKPKATPVVTAPEGPKEPIRDNYLNFVSNLRQWRPHDGKKFLYIPRRISRYVDNQNSPPSDRLVIREFQPS